MANYRAEQHLAISGSECGTEIELKMVVDFAVTDYSPATQTDPAEECAVEDIVIRYFLGKSEVSLHSRIEDAFVYDTSQFSDWLLSEANERDESARDDAADQKREAMRDV